MSAISVNTYLRGLKAYVRWLHSEGHLKEIVKVQFLKTEQKIIQTLPASAVASILKFSRHCANDRRIHAFICLLLDTACGYQKAWPSRGLISTGTTWSSSSRGKGTKYRLVPMSVEGRKILFKSANRHKHELIFSTRSGLPLSRRNAGRDMQQLGKARN